MKRNEIYKCAVCGNIVEMINVGGGKLVCCGEPMKLQKENTVDAAIEKHVPVVKIAGNKVTVSVGTVVHPMEEKHYIQVIEIVKQGKVIASATLYPGEKPEAVFTLKDTSGINAREYCNLHGLWVSS
jgi:superoxide reductase